MKSILILLLLFQILSAVTLKEIITTALDNSPSMKEYLYVIQLAENDFSSAKSGYLPKINFDVTYGQDTKTYNSASSSGTFDNTGASISIEQSLFEGFKTIRTREREQYKIASSKYKEEEIRGKFIYSIISMVTSYKNLDIELKSSKNLLVEFDDYMIDASDKFGAGQLTLLELNELKAQMVVERLNYSAILSQYKQARIALQRIYGDNVEAFEIEDFIYDGVIVMDKLENIKLALTNNPSLLSEENSIRATRKDVEVSKSSLYPSVVLSSRYYQRFDSGLAADPLGVQDQFSVSLVFKWNLYNGHSDMREIEKKKIEIHKGINTLEQVKEDLLSEIQLSLENLENLSIQKNYLYQHYSFVSMKVGNTLDEYNYGKKNIVAMISALTQRYSSEKKVLTNSNNLTLAKFRVISSLGLLPDIFENDEFGIYDESESTKTDINICYNSKGFVNDIGCSREKIKSDIYKDLSTNEKHKLDAVTEAELLKWSKSKSETIYNINTIQLDESKFRNDIVPKIVIPKTKKVIKGEDVNATN